MRNILRSSLGLVLFTLLPALSLAADGKAAAPADKTYKIIPGESKVTWVGKKVTGAHNGTTGIKEGTAVFKDGALTGGSVELDMQAIVVEDLKDAEFNKKLTDHLKSDDFFSVASHPTAKFEISKASKGKKAGEYKVDGNLTIKGITKPVSFDMTMLEKDGKATGEANFKIDRTQWDIKYGSGKFFQSLGDKMIYDDIEIGFKISAQ